MMGHCGACANHPKPITARVCAECTHADRKRKDNFKKKYDKCPRCGSCIIDFDAYFQRLMCRAHGCTWMQPSGPEEVVGEEINKECPKCHKKMITVATGITYATYPSGHEMQWWCMCGYTAKAETVWGKTDEQRRQESWEEVNGIYSQGEKE